MPQSACASTPVRCALLPRRTDMWTSRILARSDRLQPPTPHPLQNKERESLFIHYMQIEATRPFSSISFHFWGLNKSFLLEKQNWSWFVERLWRRFTHDHTRTRCS